MADVETLRGGSWTRVRAGRGRVAMLRVAKGTVHIRPEREWDGELDAKDATRLREGAEQEVAETMIVWASKDAEIAVENALSGVAGELATVVEAASDLGKVVGRVAVYGEGDELLGYVPVYDVVE